MKKLFVSILAIAALAACANEELVSVNQEAIEFGGPFVENSTRTAIDPSYGENGADLKLFNVYGTVNGGNGLVAIFAGDEVKGDVGANVWSCDVKQYWIKDATYNFAALVNAPATEGAVTLTDYLPTKVNGFTADGATDLMYAPSEEDIVGLATGNQPVDFTFDHLLSKVKFTVVNNSKAAAEYSFKVNNITITGNKTGNVTLATKAWDTLSNPGAYDVAEIVVNKNTDNAGEECAQELLLIPGEFTIAFNVDIYNGTTKLGSQAYPIAPATYKYNLTAGYSYNFVVNVAVGELIQFTVEEQPEWTSNGNTTLL